MGETNNTENIPPSEGFLKVSGAPALDGSQRSALIRKGNELYNKGELHAAKRVFITTRYSDGLIRLGDHYQKQKQPLEAFRMYWLAGETRRKGEMVEQMAGVVRHWLEEKD
ncbi:MAG: hypothetical protein ACOC45_00740 [Alkalispirochaetaceae bacterium]